jgi:epoxyqueuosine reductase
MVMETKRTPLLLHCCCGPCSTASIERLRELNYEPILFFGNSNIFPLQEANRRYQALEQVANYFQLQLIRKPWEHSAWREAVVGHEDDLEKGERCAICFNWNLKEARAQALRLGIVHFTTTLTVSPHKNSPLIFSIGQDLEGFLQFDFKKKGGYQRSIELSKELGIYRQQYCGCEFSLRDSMQKKQTERHDGHSSQHTIDS